MTTDNINYKEMYDYKLKSNLKFGINRNITHWNLKGQIKLEIKKDLKLRS